MNTRRHALLVGIDRYPLLPGRDLRGCVNDARVMAGLLIERFEFGPDDVEVLTDEAATRDGLLAAFARLEARVGPDEQAVIFYAGHGSRIAREEADPIESLVAHDSGRGADPNRDVMDFEVDAFVQRLNQKTPWVTLLFDCCHSGSVTRDAFGTGVREVESETRSLTDLGFPADAGVAEPSGSFVPGRRQVVLLAACRADEKAAELQDPDTGAMHGAMTCHLARALAGLSGRATWRDVFNALAPPLSARFTRQHPQLEGQLDTVVFGRAVRPASEHLAVTAIQGDHAWLSGGALHGVSPGSRWQLAPTLSEGAPAQVEIEVVEALRARVPAPEGVEIGWRALPEQIELPSPKLRVTLRTPDDRGADRRRMEQALGRSRLLEVVAADAAEVALYLLAPRPDADGPCPTLGAVAEWCWAAVGEDGRLLSRVRGLSEVDGLRADLERAARFRGLLAMRFPDHDADLAASVEFTIERMIDGAPYPAMPRAGDACPHFDSTEPAELRIRNGGAKTVYVNLVEFGVDGAIQLMLPMEGNSTQRANGHALHAGEEVALAKDYFSKMEGLAEVVADGLRFHLPERFPYGAEPGELNPVGTLVYRLIVTREPADFSFLKQEGHRAADLGAPTHPLTDRFALYQSGQGARSLLPRAARKRPAPFAVITRMLTVSRPDPRQISPSTNGLVLFYKASVNGVDDGELAITPTGVGLWNCFHDGWPSAFTLTPSDELPETAIGDRVDGARRLSNPKFGAEAPAGTHPDVLQSWKVTTNGVHVAWMGRTKTSLKWFGLVSDAYLPKTVLEFVSGPLPSGGQVVHHAVDTPV